MKKLPLISFIFNGILIIVAVLFFYFYPGYLKKYQKDLVAQYNHQKISVFEVLPKTKSDIVFLGASIIEGANWSEMFQNPNIRNRGIAGNQTTDILARLDEALSSKPDKLFLQVGFNDLNAGISQEEYLANYQKILDKIKAKSSKTKVYIISLLPVRYDLLGKKIKNEQLMIANGKLREMAQKYDLIFIDAFTALEDKSETHELNPDYTNDGLHLTADGYTRLKAILERFVAN